jgi:PPOX class probable F420-dependent enzyme
MPQAEPRPHRPRFPEGYGISANPDGLLPWSWATERLAGSRNYWIGTTRPDGSPHAAPVWGLWDNDRLVFSTSLRSRKGRNLTRDPRLVAHVESGDEVVILEGEVEAVSLDEPLADAYEAKYGYRPAVGEGGSAGWFGLSPRLAHAWLERDYPRTATRYHFTRAAE